MGKLYNMRRELGSFLFGSALNIVCLLLAYKYPAMSDTIINVGLIAGTFFMILGVYLFLVPSRNAKSAELKNEGQGKAQEKTTQRVEANFRLETTRDID